MRSIVCLLFLLFPLCAQEAIVVHVKTGSTLLPIAIRTKAQTSCFEAGYLPQLEAVMRFDLGHNGRCTVASGAAHLVELSLDGKGLVAVLNAPGRSKQFKGLQLSGVLAEDRRCIHQVADAIYQALFNETGITSTHILYTLRTRKSLSSAQWISEVWECDYDGANAKQVTHDGHLCVTPTYLGAMPGGLHREFLFVSYKIGQPKIYACNTADGSLKRLSYLRGNQLMPALSVQQDAIAFISDAGGNPDLFVQQFSPENGLVGKPRQLFSSPMAAQGSPTFSPDGRRIAFVSNKDGTARIYTIGAVDAGGLTLISKRNRDNTSPVWSPDGQMLAYCAQTNGVRQIWVYDFLTRQETQLTDGPVHKENPTWAPDSVHVMFNSATESNAELYLINLNQKEAIQITSGPGEKRFPSWEPQPSKRTE